MKFIIQNTKTNEINEVEENQIANKFECDSFLDKYCLRNEYNEFLKIIDDEEKKEYIEYWNNECRYIIDDKIEYLTEMVEYEVWTSPEGVKSIYKVIEVK